jgi:ABC-type transporter Mla subunit MlaD
MMLETVIGRRYRYYQRSVGLLVLATLGVLFAMLWMANRQVGFFSQTYRLHGFLDNVRNIQKTTPVTLAGLKIGEVRDLAITDYNRIRVELILDRAYQPRIRRDSSAQVRTDLLGNARIEIDMGTSGQPMLPDGADIAFLRSPDLDALLRQVQEQLAQVAAILANVRTLTEELRKPEGALLGTLDALARMTQEFSTRMSGFLQRIDVVLRDATELSGQLNPMLRDLTLTSGEMYRVAADLAAVSERIRRGRGVLGGLTDSDSPLSRDVETSARKLRAVLTGVEQLTTRLPRYSQQVERILRQAELMTAQLAEASSRAPGLLDKSQRVAEDMDEMVGDIRQSILLRGLNPPEPARPPLDAPRDAGWSIPAAPP